MGERGKGESEGREKEIWGERRRENDLERERERELVSSAKFLVSWRRRFSTCLQKENVNIILKKLSAIIGRCQQESNISKAREVRCFGIDFM